MKMFSASSNEPSLGGHFLGYPQADASPYQAEPDHEIILY